ncbi:MAG: bifunctional phosphopantothenoylcysteine decarboxylase/phosphopantothenate--cysteine ligase CoaBC [Chitinophagaceae bacterium]|nr:bifunctional phosphopantothenoylcysteine decarboxylase/phosphopantothenate--cysteine ligase CoaBC [Chitinophagaceae bacterium]
MMQGKKILLGITGSIAAYKAAYLVRMLKKEGADVKVIMTPAAKDFVSPLTLSTLSQHPVLTHLFDEQSWSNHVMLGRWADVMLLAPLSCNTLAKMANGQCDNLLLAVYLSATCPVVVAPAMDEDMWQHPATQENIQKIKANGNQVIPVEKGELASGLIGEGRMAEPEEIVRYLQEHFFLTQPLHGKKALVTAGPTYEPIDPVRFIGNRSSGKMGWAIANELKKRGAAVTLILGPSHLNIEPNGILVEKVNTADEMYRAALQNFATADIAIMAAAVADYTPEHPENEKIKKNYSTLQIQLTKTKDILKSLGQQKTKQQVLVGFALETNDEEKFAKQKLIEKNADLIVLNSLKDEGAGFGVDTNKITIFEKNGQVFRFDQQPKNIVAKDIIDTLIKLYYD